MNKKFGLLLALLLVTKVSAAKPDVTIKQIIIVYAPEQDHNGSFATIGFRFSSVLEAAKKKNLKIVLIDANKAGVKNAAGLSNLLDPIVKSSPSWVILATHGQYKTKGSETDTVLSFPGGVSVTDLSSTLSNSKGVLLNACYGFSSALSKCSPVAIATSNSLTEGSLESSFIVSQALAKLIDSAEPVVPGPFLKSKLQDEIIKHPRTDGVARLTGNPFDPATFPISYSDEKSTVVFEGSKFQTIGPNGESLMFCQLSDLVNAGILGEVFKEFGSYSSPVFPGILERLDYKTDFRGMYKGDLHLFLPPSVDFRLQSYYSRIECSGTTGRWRIQSPKQCLGEQIKIDNCTASAEKNATWKKEINKGLWEQGCRRLKDFFDHAKKENVDFVDLNICITPCLLGAKDDDWWQHPEALINNHSKWIAPGSCRNGEDGVCCPLNTVLLPIGDVPFTKSPYSVESSCCNSSHSNVFHWTGDKCVPSKVVEETENNPAIGH